MPSYSEDPVKHVISFRVNDYEKECLQRAARSLGINISILLRESVTLLMEKRNESTRLLSCRLNREHSFNVIRSKESGSQSLFDHLLPSKRALGATNNRKTPRRDFQAAYSIKGVENALATLEALSEAEGEIRVTRLCETLSMNKTSVLRLLLIFEQRGYVEKSENPGSYRLGLASYEVGQKFLSRMELLKKAKPAMKRLSKQCNEAVYLAVPRQDEVLMLGMVDTIQVVGTAPLIGNSYPILQTAAGKAIREMNPSIDIGGFGKGAASVAAPLLGQESQVFGSLCIVGPEFRFTIERIKDDLMPSLKDACGMVSSMLGYRGKQYQA